MFSWFKKQRSNKSPKEAADKTTPTKNIGETPRETGRDESSGLLVANFSKAGKTWTEQADMIAILSELLTAHGYAHLAIPSAGRIQLANGFNVQPRFGEMKSIEEGGCRTGTTIGVHHTTLIPSGAYEYQHAAGDDLAKAITSGFENWIKCQ